ncbi:translation initiation factor IF-2 isoform X3 [Herpailurus yagouaroundi]|uniref:translation initiation factor IF-2 isoform X3 n=1 Tax=Herpailurus yagouaroundi TaxID=1608482 RepID=UPI001AD6D013|nr:translation initiation factor IF-2-like isoform X3 [Puma yagouaroundi]
MMAPAVSPLDGERWRVGPGERAPGLGAPSPGPDGRPQEGAAVGAAGTGPLQRVRGSLWPSFLGARPCPGIPAVGVPALPAQAWAEGSWRQTRFLLFPPPQPPGRAAAFRSAGRGLPPEPAVEGPGRRPPARRPCPGTCDVAVAARGGGSGAWGLLRGGEGALRLEPSRLRARKQGGVMEFDRRWLSESQREPMDPGLGKAWRGCGQPGAWAAVPVGSPWHLQGGSDLAVNAARGGMKRARDRIQRALEKYPRGFRRSEMWAENEIQI